MPGRIIGVALCQGNRARMALQTRGAAYQKEKATSNILPGSAAMAAMHAVYHGSISERDRHQITVFGKDTFGRLAGWLHESQQLLF